MSKEKSFVERSLADYEKTEKDLIKEGVEAFQESAVIECQTQIGLIKTSELPRLNMQLKHAEVKLSRAQKEYEKTRFKATENKTVLSFERYIQNRNNAKKLVTMVESEISDIEGSIHSVEESLNDWEEVLGDLQ